VDCHEPVPFRLTRNLTTFLTPFVVDGIFTSAFSSVNTCLLNNQVPPHHCRHTPLPITIVPSPP
jgi:hypothetical protein